VIIENRPPNFEQIHAVFPQADAPGVLFAYDGAVYNPSGYPVPPALMAHEEVHLTRQQALNPTPLAVTRWVGADLWWARYLEDSEFRYYEELLAHAAEFKMLRYEDRNSGAALLMRTALRLTAPLYKYDPQPSLQQALKDLRREIAK
jgi:hypothetical protein